MTPKSEHDPDSGDVNVKEIALFVAGAIVLLSGGILFGLWKSGALTREAPDRTAGYQGASTYPAATEKPHGGAHGDGTPDPLLVHEGEQTYSAFCAACHQPGATGLPGFAPSIRNRDFLAIAGDDFIRTTIRMGRPGTAMVPWSHLTDRQIDGILAYLHTARDYHPVAIEVDPAKKYPGDAARGETTFQAYCAACHGAEGRGYAAGGSGPGIGLAGFLAVASDDYIFQTVKHGRIGTPMRPLMGPAGLANLSEGEVGDVIAYLRSLKPDAGATTLAGAAGPGDPVTGEQHFNVNCVACHQMGGVGKPGFAPSIRNRDFLAIAGDDFIVQTIRSGRPGTAMLPRPDLSDQVVSDIIAYLRSLPEADGVKVPVDPAKTYTGNATAGHTKFATYCAACHGPKGNGYAGGGSGPAIGLDGFLSAASDDYIFQTVKRGRVGTAMRPFIGPGGIANLSESDVSDIITYLRTLN